MIGGIEANNLSINPYFLDAAGGDFHLQSGSPAINAGKDLSSDFTTDFDGNSRTKDGDFDIGAYEFIGNPANSALGAPVGVKIVGQ